jgi:hypothetical protein
MNEKTDGKCNYWNKTEDMNIRASLIIRFYEAGILPPKTASRSDLTDLVYCM